MLAKDKTRILKVLMKKLQADFSRIHSPLPSQIDCMALSTVMRKFSAKILKGPKLLWDFKKKNS